MLLLNCIDHTGINGTERTAELSTNEMHFKTRHHELNAACEIFLKLNEYLIEIKSINEYYNLHLSMTSEMKVENISMNDS